MLDDIEGNLERTRIKEDDERTKKRKQEDAAIVRKREVADEKREARQEELCERETVRLQADARFDIRWTDLLRPLERSSRRANYLAILHI